MFIAHALLPQATGEGTKLKHRSASDGRQKAARNKIRIARGGKMERIEAFEAMLKAALEQSEAERQKMEALKAQGREKSATYRQYLGNRLFYNQLFALYRQYGLIGQCEE